MNYARVVAGSVVKYPYKLRPDAKQAHPELSPLPGTFEQCTPAQMATLEAVEVQDVTRPDDSREGLPVFTEGEWRQNWISRPSVGPSEVPRWDGTQWQVHPAPVPDSVETHKVLIAMDAAGYLTSASSLIDAANGAIKIAFDRAPYIHRNSPMVVGMASQMWPSDDDATKSAKLDALFIAAAAIET